MPATKTPSAALIARFSAYRAMPGFYGGTQRQIRACLHAHGRFLEAAADEDVSVAAVYALAGVKN